MSKWIIKDWTAKVCFLGIIFDSFEEAWDYIYVNDPEPAEDHPDWKDHWYDDYFVEEVV